MARARMSESGTVELPRALREAVGLVPGGEVEITQSGGRLIVEPVPAVAPEKAAERKLSIERLLAMRIPYSGPPLTDAMMHDAIDAEARRMWEAFEKQSAADADD